MEGLALIIILVIVLVILNMKIVPQAQAYVIQRLGAYHTTWGVGFHIKIPFIDTNDENILYLYRKTFFYLFLCQQLNR